MRLTLAGHAGSRAVDLDVADDARLADLRPHLAAVTGRAELAGSAGRTAVPLAVDDVVLAEDHLTGEFPLLPGAVLRIGSGPPDLDRAALRAARHLAVVAGPDAGGLVPLDARTVVGRRPRGSTRARPRGRSVVLDDPTLSERQVEVVPGRRGLRVRDLASRNGTMLVRARHPDREVPIRRRGRRLVTGDRLVLGATVLELRAATPRPPGRRGARRRTSLTSLDAPSTWIAPAAGAAVLAAATGNRLLLVLAAVGPATALAGVVAGRCSARLEARRASRRRGRPVGGASERQGPTLPVAADLRTASLVDGSWTTGLGADRAGTRHDPGPADGDGSRGASAVTDVARGGRSDPATGSGRPVVPPGLGALAPDGCLAVVGPRSPVLAVARLLACAEVGRSVGAAAVRPRDGAPRPGGGPSPPPTTPTGLVVVAHPRDDDVWRWARWVAPPPGRDPAVLVVDGPPGAADGGGRSGPGAADGTGSWGRIPSGIPVVLLAGVDGTRVPPWCRTVLEVSPDGRTTVLSRPGTPPVTLPLCGVSVVWSDRQARLVHALTGRRRAGVPRSAFDWREAGAGDPDGAGPDGTAPVGRALPAVVALADLPGVPAADPASILRAWRRSERRTGHGAHDTHDAHDAHDGGDGLPAVLGVGAGGRPLVLDLVRDGPHGLVAGTTGAGKSGLLQTWVLALALTRSPTELAMLLVDYKGGAGFGPCARLPHVVGLVTDLDAALAARALTGMRAELRRREEVLARWSVPDLAALRRCAPAEAPPRLLVVVDEFRALADDVPAFVPGLLRVAAQGRSLGVHLLLATQRPGGAVGPDLRANLAVRVALRVTDPSESLDVVDVPDAAAIPASAVGRAVLRRGPARPEPLQVAHADAAPRSRRALVRRVDDDRSGPSAELSRGDRRRATNLALGQESPTPIPTGAWVEAAREAADRAGLPRPAAPWLPPLPEHLALDELCGGRVTPGHGPDGPDTPDGPAHRPSSAHRPTSPTSARAGGALPLALADHPAHRRQEVVAWPPWTGPLLVLGGPASGRSTVLRTLAVGALDRGWHVHAVTAADPLGDLPEHPCRGTTVGGEDPRRLARLLRLLATPEPTGAPGTASPTAPGTGPRRLPTRPRQLLLIDGLEAVLDALEPIARGRAADLLVDLLRDGRRRGVGVAATASATPPPSVARTFTARLVLRLGDPVAESMSGVPAELVGHARVPGRGVWLPGGDRSPSAPRSATWSSAPALCQVAMADPRSLSSTGNPRDGADDERSRDTARRGPTEPAATRPAESTRPDERAAAETGPAGSRPEPGSGWQWDAETATTTRPLRLQPVPWDVTVADLGRVIAAQAEPTVAPAGIGPPHATSAKGLSTSGSDRGPAGVPIGLGGDDAGPVWLPIGAGALVVGPTGSGRSTALATIARSLLDGGTDVLLVARDGPLRALGEARVPARTCGHSPTTIASKLDSLLGAAVTSGSRSGSPLVLMVDDLESLEQRAPDVSLRLADLVAGGPDGPPHRLHPPGAAGAAADPGPTVEEGAAPALPGTAPRALVLVASAQTGAANVAFRGALAALRALRCGLVLAPAELGSNEVFGVDLAWGSDPARPHHPGRGVVVRGREVVPVQVAGPE